LQPNYLSLIKYVEINVYGGGRRLLGNFVIEGSGVRANVAYKAISNHMRKVRSSDAAELFVSAKFTNCFKNFNFIKLFGYLV
jgi:hypothetical protein